MKISQQLIRVFTFEIRDLIQRFFLLEHILKGFFFNDSKKRETYVFVRVSLLLLQGYKWMMVMMMMIILIKNELMNYECQSLFTLGLEFA